MHYLKCSSFSLRGHHENGSKMISSYYVCVVMLQGFSTFQDCTLENRLKLLFFNSLLEWHLIILED